MISKEFLKEILLEQEKRMGKTKTEGFVGREALEEIKKFIKIRHSVIITGVRRCGKSVFLSQIMDKFFDKPYYVNFEDERLKGFDLTDFSKLYEVCIELFGKESVFFLDEVQNVREWERWTRRMYDDGFKFFITGSNANLLSKELATLLTGRHLQFPIFPFSFREFLRFYKFDFKEQDVYFAEKRAVIMKHFSDYLKMGGFPEYLRYKRIEILQGYFNDIIQRDVVERYNIKNVKRLKELARFLITNTASLTTFNQLKKLTEIKSVNTVINYLSYLENAYLLFKVPYFSFSLRKQVVNPFKAYAIDIGLRNAIAFKFSKDLGRAYETVVAIELKRKNKEIYYWKNPQHEEVDFVVKSGRGDRIEKLIQVCYDLSDYDTKKRELRALLKAGKELKCRNLMVITSEHEGVERVKNKTVKFVPLWKWLLAGKP